MPDVTAPLRKAIIRVFTRKYNLQLHASALGFIADVFYQHGMLHSPQDWEEGLEHLAKQYIDSEHYSGTTTAGAMAAAASSSSSSLVTAEALEAVYQKMILADTNGHSSSVAGPSSSSRRDLHQDEDSLEDSSYVHHTILEHEKVDPNRHFQVIDAFQLPRTRWDPARKTFEIAPRGSVLPLAVARPNTLRERLSLVKSIVLRNENFLPPLAVGRGKERNAFMKITSIKNLAGRQGERFLLLGLLCTLHDGRYALEDGDGSVLLDLKHAAAGEGIFTEGAIVLVSGEYLHNETFRVDDMGQPPSERRSEARSMYGHIDFLGTGATTAKEEKVLREYEKQHEDLTMAVLSDFAIDNPKTLASFRTILQGCVDSGFVPFVFVLCGDFCADGARSGGDTMRRYTEAFSRLADVLGAFPTLLRSSHFVFVPGPHDPFPCNTIPKRPLPEIVTQKLRDRAPGRVHFTSNPCRLRFFSQEIVISRSDLMAKMLRNVVSMKTMDLDSNDLRKYLVSTLLDQAHLSPLPQQVQPILWEYDHALRLYPMPSALILADKYDRYELKYEGCRIFNPGSFRATEFGWSTYYFATGKVERSALPQA